MPDRIEETLRTLSRDLEQASLPDSGAIRRRGDQRTRHQALGSAAVVLVVIAGIAGLAGGLRTDREAIAPADGPSVSVVQEPLREIAADPFLRPADFGSFGGYDQVGPFIDAGKEPVVDPQQCRLRPTTWGAEQVRATQFYQDGSEVSLYEYVLQFGTVAEAEAALAARAAADLSQCPSSMDPADGELTLRGLSPVPGLDGQRTSRYFVPKVASEPHYYEAAVAREANVVVVLDWSAFGNPAGEGDTDWVWTTERLRSALDRAVVR